MREGELDIQYLRTGKNVRLEEEKTEEQERFIDKCLTNKSKEQFTATTNVSYTHAQNTGRQVLRYKYTGAKSR